VDKEYGLQDPPEYKMKYSGMFNCMKQVYIEEGPRKLFLGGIHPRFMFNMFNGAIFLFVYDRFIVSINNQFISRNEASRRI
jgi:hypothetical protein